MLSKWCSEKSKSAIQDAIKQNNVYLTVREHHFRYDGGM